MWRGFLFKHYEMKLFLFFFCVYISAGTFSQSSMQLAEVGSTLSLPPNAVINVTVGSNATAINYIDIKNISASNKSFGMKRYSVTLNTNGTFTATPYFIYNGTQYPASANASVSQLTLSAGQSASGIPGPAYLVVHLDELANVGFSQVKYTVFNTANISDSVQITFNYNASTSIRKYENDLSFLRAYTDQTNDIFLDILSNQNAEADVLIQNINGSVILLAKMTLITGNNKTLIRTNNLSEGLYFVTIKCTDQFRTMKLLVN
jgi:hypothetical protein